MGERACESIHKLLLSPVNDMPEEERVPEPLDPPATGSPSSLTAAARDLGGGSAGFDFFSSAVAGLLLGLGIDWLAGTSPWFTIAGVVARLRVRLHQAVGHLTGVGGAGSRAPGAAVWLNG